MSFPYRVEATLGEGGMGTVYRAWDPRLERHVALKWLREGPSEERLERFEREGELTARLDHPGIVRVHEAGVHEGRPFLAYELVEGCCTLEEAFRTRSVEERLELVVQAAEALGYAHGRGIVHRDVKPENVLVDAGGRVKVADFGLAVAGDLERLTRSGVLLGTPLFMAPEQIRAERGEVGPWTDVWALGVISYLALTDELPFEGYDVLGLAGAIVSETPVWPSARVGGALPRAAGAACLKALRKRPSARFSCGQEFGEALVGVGRRRWRWWWVVLPSAAAAVAGWVGGAREAPSRGGAEEVVLEEVEVEAEEVVEAPTSGRSVAGYVERVRWLRSVVARDVPERGRVERELRSWRRQPLAASPPPSRSAGDGEVWGWSEALVLGVFERSPRLWCQDLRRGAWEALTEPGEARVCVAVKPPGDDGVGEVWYGQGPTVWRGVGLDPRRMVFEAQWETPSGWSARRRTVTTVAAGSGAVEFACGGFQGWVFVASGGVGGWLELPSADTRRVVVAEGGARVVAIGEIDEERSRDLAHPLGLWELGRSEPLLDRRQLSQWNEVAFAPNGRDLFAADEASRVTRLRSDDGVQEELVDPDAGRAWSGVEGVSHAYPVRALAVDASGDRVYSGSCEVLRGPAEVKVWEASTGRLLGVVPTERSVHRLRVSADGALVYVTYYGGRLEVWGGVGAMRRGHPGPCEWLAGARIQVRHEPRLTGRRFSKAAAGSGRRSQEKERVLILIDPLFRGSRRIRSQVAGGGAMRDAVGRGEVSQRQPQDQAAGRR